MSTLRTYEAPKGAVGREDYRVWVRIPGEPWKELFVYEVKVDMHQVRQASMVYFDMEGEVEVKVEGSRTLVRNVVIRPLSAEIRFTEEENSVSFLLNRPCKLSIEMDGDRFSNLHLFANPLETEPPSPEDEGVLMLKPAIHRTEDIYRLAQTPKTEGGKAPTVLYFGPGMHWLEETLLRIPSGMTVYIAGGAIVAGSLVCERVRDVTIRGRGMLYLSDFHRFSAFRGIRIVFSENISVEGITTLDPPHYSIYLGQSNRVSIRNFKSFSTRGWSDGIDMMACTDIEVDDVFLRTSDDCIAIYGTRWDYHGDSRHITVRNSVFWADVAHPLMIGTHGDHHKDGDTMEDILFENIDILEHHEPQPNYMGTMAINAGDKNTVRRVTYRDIRVEDFELGRLVDLRVVWNKDYNPVPGNRIEDIRFERISYNGANRNPSQILGFDAERGVAGVHFSGLRINGEEILRPEDGNFVMNEYAQNVTFASDQGGSGKEMNG
jgi:hypothetical protein